MSNKKQLKAKATENKLGKFIYEGKATPSTQKRTMEIIEGLKKK